MFSARQAVWSVLGVATIVVGMQVAEAGKKPPAPPPPPPPIDGTSGGGTIWFAMFGSGSQPLWRMGADGSAKTALPVGIRREPGYLLHAGHRWFLRTQTVAGTYPDGTGRREIAAVRDDGIATVQLTDDPDVKPLLPESKE